MKQKQPIKGKTSLRCRRQNYNFYFHRMLKMQIIIIQIINIQMIGVSKVRAVGLVKGSQETGSNKFDSCSSINFLSVQIWLLFCANLVLLRCVGVRYILIVLSNIESSPTLFNIKTSNSIIGLNYSIQNSSSQDVGKQWIKILYNFNWCAKS